MRTYTDLVSYCKGLINWSLLNKIIAKANTDGNFGNRKLLR